MEDFIRGIIELCMYLGFYKVMCILALICLIRISCNISDIKVDIHKLVSQKENENERHKQT